MRIFINCLASYNDGIFHGEWIDLAQINSVDDLMKFINNILESSPIKDAEEWFITDYEGFGKININEYESLENIIKLKEYIKDCGESLLAYAEHYGCDIETLIDDYQNSYIGSFEDKEDFIKTINYETFEILENLKIAGTNADYFLDIDLIIKEYEYSGVTFIESNNELYAFS